MQVGMQVKKWALGPLFLPAPAPVRECVRYNNNAMMASTMKMITSHFAIDIEIPATPRAPSSAKTNASMKNKMANPSKSAIIYLLRFVNRQGMHYQLLVFIIFLDSTAILPRFTAY
jgi:hypothetical protein